VIEGFCTAEAASVPPGKVHAHAVGEFVDRSANETELPVQTVVGQPTKLTTGGEHTFTVINPENVAVFEPAPFVAVRVTGYMPAVAYVTTGFCKMEVAGVPPVKVHCQELGELVERSVNVTAPPAQSVVGAAEKLVTGATGQLVTVM